MRYKQIPDAKKSLPKEFFSEKWKKEFKPSESLLQNYKQKYYKQENPSDIHFLHELIDFYKKSIEKYEWKEFGFIFKDTVFYQNINEFYKDVDDQAYKISFSNIPDKQIWDLVKDGALYLFKIYNKDFSPCSHGTPNLHTIYWKALFDEDNLKDVVYKLNGKAEIFWREKSIKGENIIKHNAGERIPCRRDSNKESIFTYDLIKDKRFTEDKYLLHVPITLNFKANGQKNINQEAQTYIKEHIDDISIIGIDRGERNLLYYSLIDTKGNIKGQGSLNKIDNDYHELLTNREQERKKSQQEWTEIGQIKDLKTGYLSQAIHKITDLMIQNNAIIILENLNHNFKRSRIKIGYSIYQKFEKMLIDKLSYLVIKNQKEKMESGGVMRAYQLTSYFESFKKLELQSQSGFLFYVSPWLTSEIDPTTGFINLFETDYKNINESKEFVRDFVDIRYNQEEKYFEFEINKRPKFIKNSLKKVKNLKTDWVICSHGDRIIHYKKDNQWKSEKIDITQKICDLFNEYQIRFNHIKDDIVKINEKDFFTRFMQLFGYVVQMRNTVRNTVKKNLTIKAPKDYEDDYILSPVKNKDRTFFDSRKSNNALPKSADANGAYNIARKGLLILEKIQNSNYKDIKNTNEEWIKFAQKSR